MKLRRSIRKYLRLRRHSRHRPAFARAKDELRARTKAFSAATTLDTQTTSFTRLFHTIWTGSSERSFNVRLLCWLRMVEHDDLLRLDFQEAFQSMVSQLDSVAVLAEAGLPRHHAVFSEGLRRLFNRLLPSAMAVTDSSRLMIALFAHSRDVERFLELPQPLFRTSEHDSRSASYGGWAAFLSSLAERFAPGTVPDCYAHCRPRRHRSHARSWRPAEVQNSPFYHLIFATQQLVEATDAAEAAPRFEVWKAAISSCRKELGQVRLGMETTGVSADLVLDLRSIELALMRMHGLARVLSYGAVPVAGVDSSAASRNLLNQLIEGRLEDKRVSALLKQNLNLLARKTVERTGRSGEHYIAHSRKEYWQMWLAAVGGGLLTVLTAAFKMRIVEQHFPLFVEGFSYRHQLRDQFCPAAGLRAGAGHQAAFGYRCYVCRDCAHESGERELEQDCRLHRPHHAHPVGSSHW